MTTFLRRLIGLLFALPFTALVVLLAVSNTDTVSLELFPLPFVMDLPLYLVLLGSLLLGFLAGALFVWVLGYGVRVAARRDSKRAARLEKELAEIRSSALRLSSD